MGEHYCEVVLTTSFRSIKSRPSVLKLRVGYWFQLVAYLLFMDFRAKNTIKSIITIVTKEITSSKLIR